MIVILELHQGFNEAIASTHHSGFRQLGVFQGLRRWVVFGSWQRLELCPGR